MSENDRYETYEDVPAGFNLLDASPGQLDLYGIPPKTGCRCRAGPLRVLEEARFATFLAKTAEIPRSSTVPLSGQVPQCTSIELELVGGTHSAAPAEAVRLRGRRLDCPERESAAGAGAFHALGRSQSLGMGGPRRPQWHVAESFASRKSALPTALTARPTPALCVVGLVASAREEMVTQIANFALSLATRSWPVSRF